MTPVIFGDFLAPVMSSPDPQVDRDIASRSAFAEVLQPLIPAADKPEVIDDVLPETEKEEDINDSAGVFDNLDDIVEDPVIGPVAVGHVDARPEAKSRAHSEPRSSVKDATPITPKAFETAIMTEVVTQDNEKAQDLTKPIETALSTVVAKPRSTILSVHPIAHNFLADHVGKTEAKPAASKPVDGATFAISSSAPVEPISQSDAWIPPQHTGVSTLVADVPQRAVLTEEVVADIFPSAVGFDRSTTPGQLTSFTVAQAKTVPGAVIRQIAVAVTTQKGGTIEIALNPQELGRVSLQMTPQEATMTLQVTADRPETLELLRRHVDLLTQELKQLGYAETAFSFTQSEREQSDRKDPDQANWMQEVVEAKDAEIAAPTIRVTSGIDIRI